MFTSAITIGFISAIETGQIEQQRKFANATNNASRNYEFFCWLHPNNIF
jgi:hypothetical protein